MRGSRKLLAASLMGVVCGGLAACVSEGPGSDFDRDGLIDEIEDRNESFAIEPGETDFIRTDTDQDGLCDGLPRSARADCTGCEDCNNDGFWEPCLTETDPLNDDTDNDGVRDAQDPAPVDRVVVDCSQGDVRLAYGDSLPEGKPPPGPRPTTTATPPPTATATPPPAATPTP